jgi:hypothetical protein
VTAPSGLARLVLVPLEQMRELGVPPPRLDHHRRSSHLAFSAPSTTAQDRNRVNALAASAFVLLAAKPATYC